MQLVANFIHKSTCLYSENRTGDISSYTLILNRFQTIQQYPRYSINTVQMNINKYLSYDMQFIVYYKLNISLFT